VVKTVSFFLACLCLLSVAGCVVADRDVSEVGTQLQDGLQGRGQIIQPDPTTDSFGQEFR